MMEEMREKNENSFPAITGASSLLVIFCVLCLTVFALLSMSTVSADHRIAEENAKALTAYYDADYEANEILAKIRGGSVPEGVAFADGAYEYSCTVSDTQMLKVRVRVEGTEYEILQWQTVSTYDWEPDMDLPVWQDQE
ncbi:MAG: hypothetical protein IJM49_03645 [Firmicutes bacterium]|nr:hypothetical protein [Bacillota bacterium]MBR0482347.1 hypothetical protein [Bacillota bacterium]